MNSKNSRKKFIALIFVPVVVACVISESWSLRSTRAQFGDSAAHLFGLAI